MGYNLPDGVRQEDIDRAHDGDETDETLDESFEKLEAQVEQSVKRIDRLEAYNLRLRDEVKRLCPECVQYKGQMNPGHFGSDQCESGSLASGGTKSHCSCSWCF